VEGVESMREVVGAAKGYEERTKLEACG